MSMIVMFPPLSLSSKIDISRCIKMALFHDLVEALVGDITPMNKVSKEDKNRRESTTMEYFTNSLLGKVNGSYIPLWARYCSTVELCVLSLILGKDGDGPKALLACL
jgi:5'-deoxynucleotidase YfbR-like HD superfamily hydrolase